MNLSSSGSKKERDFERINSDLGLQFYFVSRLSLRINKFWSQFDAFSGKIGSGFTYERILSGSEKELLKLSAQTTTARLILGYSVWNKSNEKDFKFELIPFIGLRFYDTGIKAEILDSFFVSAVRPIWLEPVAGLYIPVSYKRFELNLQADLGAISSKYSLFLGNYINYRISKLIEVKLGWTYLDIQHKSAINDKDLVLDIVLSGPMAGIGFRF